MPLPTVSTLLMTPGNMPPGPSTFTRGSITSFTGVIRTLSPGLATSKLKSLTQAFTSSSSYMKALTASGSTYRVFASTLHSFENWMSLIWI